MIDVTKIKNLFLVRIMLVLVKNYKYDKDNVYDPWIVKLYLGPCQASWSMEYFLFSMVP